MKMKNLYIKPVTDVTVVELQKMICVSNRVYGVSRHAEWGDKGEYAPENWINERHPNDITWPAVRIYDDTEDLTSRSKSSLWGDEDD